MLRLKKFVLFFKMLYGNGALVCGLYYQVGVIFCFLFIVLVHVWMFGKFGELILEEATLVADEYGFQ